MAHYYVPEEGSKVSLSKDKHDPDAQPRTAFTTTATYGMSNMHPLLAAHPLRPPLNFDVSLPPTHISPPLALDALAAPAVQPPQPFLRITCTLLPWYIDIDARSNTQKPHSAAFLTVTDVLFGVYKQLRTRASSAEWYAMLPTAQAEVRTAYKSRCRRHATSSERAHEEAGGLRRVDWLGDHTLFAGLRSSGPSNHWELLVRRAVVKPTMSKFTNQSDVAADRRDNGGWTSLPFLAVKGHESVVTEFLGRSDVVAYYEDKNGRTPLSYAAEKGRESSVVKLLERNDVVADSKDEGGRTPLSYAAEKGHESIVVKLLERNDVAADSKDKDGRTPLSYGAEEGWGSIVVKLLERNDVAADSKDKDGRTPLSYAAGKRVMGSVLVELLERNDVAADSKDKDGRTPLSYAAEKGSISTLVKLLERNDVAADSKDKDGRTPLSYAAEKGWESIIVKLLERNDVAADSKDKDGRMPLSYAAEKGHKSIVVKFLERDDVAADSKNKDGRTPLSYAAEKGWESIIVKLLERNDVAADSKDKDGRTPLSYGAEEGWGSIVVKLLERNDVAADSKDKDGRTPLSYAAEKGSISTLVKLLERNDVAADSKDKDGRTPLSYAAEKGWESIIVKLLERNDVAADSKDKDGRMPLSYAAEKGHKSIVVKLLKRSYVAADSKDKNGRTPLSYAAEMGWESIVVKLLEQNDVAADSKDEGGRTPLSYAAKKGHESIVMKLLKYDVVTDSEGKDDRTPLSFAVSKGHWSIVSELEDNGGGPLPSLDAEKRHETTAEMLLKQGNVVPESMDKHGHIPPVHSKGEAFKFANSVVNENDGMMLRQDGKVTVQVTMDSSNPVGMEGIAGQVIVLAAVNAHKHVDKHGSDISQLLAQYHIHHGDYIIQAGFNSRLLFDEVGLLEEITILSAIVPKQEELIDLLNGLGKILSPFLGLFRTNDNVHSTPVFMDDGNEWDIDVYTLMHAKWSPLLSQANIGSNTIFQQHFHASSHPLRDDDTSQGDSNQKGGGRTGGNGNSGSSQKGKGKEKAYDENDYDSAGQTDSSHGNVDKTHNPEDEEMPIVHFDASAEFHVLDKTPPDRPPDIFKIIGTITVPKTGAQAQKLHVSFKQLNFQHLSGSKYTQSFARVAIDSGHPITRTTVHHPHKSAASTNQETVTITDETDVNFGGNVWLGAMQFTKKLLITGMAQGGLSPSYSSKGTEAKMRTQMLSRITNFQDRGVVWWGFEVDDTNFCQHGVELFEKDLPNVDFEYLSKGPLNLSKHFDVEAAAYWSMPPPKKEWFTSMESVPSYYNLCQVVVLNIPHILEESLHYFKHITADVGPDGKVHILKGNKDYQDISEELGGKTLIEDVQGLKSVQQKSLWDVSHLEISSLQPNPTINQDANNYEWTMIESSSSQEQTRPQVESHPLTDLTSQPKP